MLLQFGSTNPAPVVPSAYPSASVLIAGITDGTYTCAYQESLTDRWFYVTEGFLRSKTDRPGFWDFRLVDTVHLVERKLCCKAVVKATGVPELGFEIKGHGPGIYTVGESMNNRSFVRVPV